MRKVILVAALAGLVAPAPAHAGIVQKIFQHIAQKKNDRVFHAAGVAYKATIRENGVSKPAIVRFSRGGASKPGQPDILGVAVKSLENNQDYLMVTAKSVVGFGTRVPQKKGSFDRQYVSSLLSFKAGGLRGPLTAILPLGMKTPIDLDAPGVGSKTRQTFDIVITQGGVLRPLKTKSLADVTVHFDEPLSPAESKGLRFTPFHDGGGVRPVGIINWLRKAAYRGSQAGRGLDPEQS
jgi:hypothetical protein